VKSALSPYVTEGILISQPNSSSVFAIETSPTLAEIIRAVSPNRISEFMSSGLFSNSSL